MKKLRETKDLRLFRKMLKLTGLWFQIEESTGGRSWLMKLAQHGRLLVYVCTVALWDWCLSRVPLRDVPRKSYTPIVVWSNFHLLSVLFFFVRRADLVEFTNGMSRLLEKRTSPWETELFNRMTDSTWRYIGASFYHVVIISCVVSFLPTICDFIYYLASDSTEPFYIPINLEVLLEETKVRSVSFYLINILNGLLVIIPSVYYVALLTMLPATVTYIYYELEVLGLKMEAWSASRGDAGSDERRANLREIIDDHNKLLRLIKIVKGLLGTSFSVQNFVSSINTGFLLHEAKQSLKEGDMMLISQQIYFFSQLVGVTFLCCYIGEILHEKGERTSERLYFLDWHEESPKRRDDLRMILAASQRPIVFDLKNKVPLNLATYAELMNRAYTLFILLESVSDLTNT